MVAAGSAGTAVPSAPLNALVSTPLPDELADAVVLLLPLLWSPVFPVSSVLPLSSPLVSSVLAAKGSAEVLPALVALAVPLDGVEANGSAAL